MKLPGDDHALSPHTGYTRDHWIAVADGLLAAAWRWATPGGARLDLPGPPSGSGVRSDGLEGFARTFLAAAFRVAGEAGKDPHGWLERYAGGLDAGTRTPGRDDAESWPLIGDHPVAGQPMVESASVALGLRLTRPWLWDHLAPAVQDRVEAWLRGALRHVPAPNNWYLFPFTVAGFLASVGRADAETAQARDRALELLDGWYRGDGWYGDGDGRAFDHYNGWALHLYPVLDAHLAGGPAPFGPRLREHLASFGLWFGGDGAPLHFGRSLTYRFAAASAVGLGAVTGDTPLRPGVSRRLLSGALRYFLDRGAVDEHGLLSLGWHGPHAPTVQHYSGPGSPYWASKAFVCLLAPPEHPLWTSTEEPAPSETADTVLALPAPGLLLQATRDDGVVRLHNHGSDGVRPHEAEAAAGDHPHYGRFAYSTRTGPTARDNPADNHFAVVVSGARSVRRRIHPLGAGQADGWGWAASWHRPVFGSGPATVPGLRVESVTVVRGRDELRVHRVLGAPPGASVEETGWATAPGESVLRPLAGWTGRAEVRAPHGTAFVPWVSLSRLTGDVDGTAVFVALAALGGEAGDSVASVVEEGVDVGWPDGFAVRIRFGPLRVDGGP
ncbi:hypothetical protein SAMN04489727_4121 [Amycolatopsis tolypomycina]|uniref:DUF2264 domain-containing protein n=1 Tax=Amycolatopsis tolypomycina TaxID=208445 RepID=A0A1H4TBL3_9PSEU|nr:DUF2264 domain-containing protein [Amycolatopsis tolypomycina]SEC53856.1 hypothetical protein SAMN04489727_4121 [Amycolatopsis tolypomycina]